MKSQKFLHVRIPLDFHQQLVKYAEDRFIPVSSVVLQSVAKTIGYKPRPDYTPVVVQPPQPPIPDEDGLIPDDDWDMADLQRRAAAAPLRNV